MANLIHELDGHIAAISSFLKQHPEFSEMVRHKFILANLAFEGRNTKPDPDRPLPNLTTIQAAQITLFDNWGQPTKPKGRKNAEGKDKNEEPTRYAIRIQAWDGDEQSINPAAQNWGYELTSNLFSASELIVKSKALRNLKPNGEPMKKNKRVNTITGQFGEYLELLAQDLPDHHFGILSRRSKGVGSKAYEQIVVLKMRDGLYSPVIESIALYSFEGETSHLELPAAFSMRQCNDEPLAGNAVLQSRFTAKPFASLANWTTNAANLITPT